MFVTSQLPIQTTKFAIIFFNVHLCSPTLKKVLPPMLPRRAGARCSGVPPNLDVGAPNTQYIAFNTYYLCKQKHRSILTNAYESIFYSINTTYKADRLKHLLCFKLGK